MKPFIICDALGKPMAPLPANDRHFKMLHEICIGRYGDLDVFSFKQFALVGAELSFVEMGIPEEEIEPKLDLWSAQIDADYEIIKDMTPEELLAYRQKQAEDTRNSGACEKVR